MPENISTVIPQHIAIICDGNRRWAKSHGWDVIKGHEYAFDKVFAPLARHAAEVGVKYLTFWVFSTENWGREKREVDALMNIFRNLFEKKAAELEQQNVRIRTIGDISKFAPDIQEKVTTWIEKTQNNTGITVTFAMNYGGKDELIRAMKKMNQAIQSGQFNAANLTQDTFTQFLDAPDIPEPELIVRTSGENRTSGFLMWEQAYSEWYIPTWHFPEFTPEKLDECIAEFNSRKRRFGK